MPACAADLSGTLGRRLFVRKVPKQETAGHEQPPLVACAQSHVVGPSRLARTDPSQRTGSTAACPRYRAAWSPAAASSPHLQPEVEGKARFRSWVTPKRCRQAYRRPARTQAVHQPPQVLGLDVAAAGPVKEPGRMGGGSSAAHVRVGSSFTTRTGVAARSASMQQSWPGAVARLPTGRRGAARSW